MFGIKYEGVLDRISSSVDIEILQHKKTNNITNINNHSNNMVLSFTYYTCLL